MPQACADFGHRGKQRNQWREWSKSQRTQLNRSREDCIVWHRDNGKATPFWVAVEAWDFVLLSKYFEMLCVRHRQRISNRLGVANSQVLKDWLQQINTLRNRCAHHARVWKSSSNTLAHSSHPSFETPPSLSCQFGANIPNLSTIVPNLGIPPLRTPPGASAAKTTLAISLPPPAPPPVNTTSDKPEHRWQSRQ
ncbi:Abi family protein [Achromobacter sp. AGC78]